MIRLYSIIFGLIFTVLTFVLLTTDLTNEKPENNSGLTKLETLWKDKHSQSFYDTKRYVRNNFSANTARYYQNYILDTPVIIFTGIFALLLLLLGFSSAKSKKQ